MTDYQMDTVRAFTKSHQTQTEDGVTALVKMSHTRSFDKGWWHDKDGKDLRGDIHVIGTKFMLIVSEISEAMEGFRKDAMDDKLPHRRMVEVELADAMIRIGDLAGCLGLDLGGAILEKMEYNAVRSDHQKENREKEGGKKF